jgi:hypothetical protein
MKRIRNGRKVAIKDEGLLVNVARSIGSTLGSVAAITIRAPKKASGPRAASIPSRRKPSKKGGGETRA